jgi:hypothetical protein
VKTAAVITSDLPWRRLVRVSESIFEAFAFTSWRMSPRAMGWEISVLPSFTSISVSFLRLSCAAKSPTPSKV